MFINPIKDSHWTSKFGLRPDPFGGGKQVQHKGIDLVRHPNTNVEVMASADGEVIRAGYIKSYGNVVMIRHTINGKRYDTNYAHLKSFCVKVEQKVKQGEVIGIMGNTGDSTGPHLHFEIHEGAYAPGQPNAVNPEKYIKFYTQAEVKKMKAMQDEIDKLKEELTEVKSSLNKLHIKDKNKNKDVEPTDWAKEDIDFAKNLDIGNGQKLTDGTYLNSPITRQEAIVLVVRAIRYVKSWVQSLLNLK